MTSEMSEIDAFKTNEFIRRRKLRLQQVREQSKDIAKKLRQRAKVEKLKQVVELDAQKQKEYFQRQNQLVKQLEHFYAKGIENIGVSHKNATEVKLQENKTDKVDLSKQRGKEAAVELRKKRQEKLDQQKKLLDRKLQAREAANEVSKEKSVAVTSKLLSKASSKDVHEQDPVIELNEDGTKEECSEIKRDMATQWDLEPNEWEPNIPELALPKDQDSVKETNNNTDSKSDKSKRLNLFALSEEMPSSLRGGVTQEDRVPVKPSLTLVSEYLQNRGLRLRETGTSKKNMDELQSLKQTIFRSRASKEVKGGTDKTPKSSVLNSAVPKKSSVTMYNHSTRNVRDIPYNEERLVVRDSQHNDDAYSQAMKESSTAFVEKDHQKKVQDIRSKVAMTKQSVEKEYRDTISFLNSLPKDTRNKPIRGAYMDENRQQSARHSRQQKLQQEYKKIVKDCKKHNCSRNKTRSKSKSPSNVDFDSSDFQYSWMPVPEGDRNLAIHTIPTSLKEGKPGNTVKFSKVDSYHEYRSRHKHTPPTKDTGAESFVEAVHMQSSDSESVSSETSSTENIRLEKKDIKKAERMSDAERIIIYKILDSKNEKSKNSKVMREIAKSLTLFDKQSTSGSHRKSKSTKINSEIQSDKKISFEELNEGVYKAVNANRDNVASLYFDKDGDKIEITEDEMKYGRPCCCNKSLSNDQQHHKGSTALQWESGDDPPQVGSSRPSNPCAGCKCGCGSTRLQPRSVEHNENKDSTKHPPSAATSTSSFKTATYDKANNALPDGGYIKLVDEGGEETGKFYIGTSGFLKDDAYEVVIQLRKKGEEKEPELTKISEEVPVNRTSASVETVETPRLDPVEVNNNENEVPDNSKELNKSSKNIQDVVINIASEVQIDRNAKHSSQSNVDINPQRSPTVREVSEKGVCTSFHDSFAVLSNVTKSGSNPRPATSTYTQTSMTSPNHRPVFFHMSSSTSTAYLSPPEMILPKFLRPDRRMSDDDLNDPRNFEMQDKIEVTDEHDYCEGYECKCWKCRHARKITVCRTKEHRCRKARHAKSKPPPNTARSDRDELDDIESKDSNEKTCQCRKCISQNRFNKPASSNKRSDSVTKRTSQNMRATSSSASANKEVQKLRQNKAINPVIRDYVNKLLALNKESLKAVQVVDQDCSSITTPGSSIINVPFNNDDKKPIQNKISLEQIKHVLKQKVLDECENKTDHTNHNLSDMCLKTHSSHNAKFKGPRRKQVHKVKSLNISKHLVKTKKSADVQRQPKPTASTSSKEELLKIPLFPSRNKVRSKSSPTPRTTPAPPPVVIRSKTSTNVAPSVKPKPSKLCTKTSHNEPHVNEQKNTYAVDRFLSSCNRATTTSVSTYSETSAPPKGNIIETPTNMSTQTSINVDSEINFLRFDQDKIQNMEKIADLTEKCTKRLSNLAKVLEEVRKNKSLAYSQISTSDTASDSDQKSDKNANKIPVNAYQSLHDTHKSLESKSPVTFEAVEELNENNPEYIPFLTDIPKPESFKMPDLELNFSSFSSNKSNPSSPTNENDEHHLKSRGKPPPALSRIHLKHVQDYVVPHELSTVVEVDSPMSVKLKSQTSRNDTRVDVPDSFNRIDNATYKADDQTRALSNPDLLVSNLDIPGKTKMATESSDDSKIQMIDMNQFNEIMLKPFFSLQEYAKQHNVVGLDDASNIDDFVKADFVNDELSSLHSDGSLPDVISELLKRNMISEPFKFETGSNVNSTTISSESTLSVLALSKVRKESKKSSVMFKNKENIGETSDTMSMSSNPDLETAFKRLGMGWASSTLKKTKERLALSSSSNTSSSSLSQFKIKSYNHDIPALVTDTVSSVLNLSNKAQQMRNATGTSKNAEQQTSLTKSMTVKEFLNNELAKKITFDKSRNETEEEFVSLFETKMPEEMKHGSRMVREDSVETSVRSANRARTSTPVQLFKSMTYQSSSSSNHSNGLFSNADDLSSVKGNCNSLKHSTSDKDDLTIPNFSLIIKKGSSECSND